MRIWVDADACPRVVKDIVFRAAERTKTLTTLVANQSMQIPRSPYIEMRTVGSGFDVADNEIAAGLQPGDLVITADLPLAAEVIEKGAHALSPRGEMFSEETIGAQVNMRDFLDTMRSSGFHTGGPPPLGKKECLQFANALDRFLSRAAKGG